MGEMTFTRPFSIVTSMPMPPKEPLVWICMSGERLGVHVARMRIEIGNHAFDGGIDELVVVDGTDIVRAHALERVGEEIELAIGAHVVGAVRRREDARAAMNPATAPMPTNANFFMSCLPSWYRGLGGTRALSPAVLTQFKVKLAILAHLRHRPNRLARQHLIAGPHHDPIKGPRAQVVSNRDFQDQDLPSLW